MNEIVEENLLESVPDYQGILEEKNEELQI